MHRLESLKIKMVKARPELDTKAPWMIALEQVLDLWLILGPASDDIVALAELASASPDPPLVEGIPWRTSGTLIFKEHVEGFALRTAGIIRLSNSARVAFLVEHGIPNEGIGKTMDLVGLTAGAVHTQHHGNMPLVAAYAVTSGGSLEKAISLWHALYQTKPFSPSPDWMLSHTRRWLGLPAILATPKPTIATSPSRSKLAKRAPDSTPDIPQRPLPVVEQRDGHMECVPRRSGGEECHYVPSPSELTRSPGN